MLPRPDVNGTRCPACGSIEHYVRVPLLYEDYTATLSGHASSSGSGIGLLGLTPGIGFGAASTAYSGLQQTELARRLEPPSPPTRRLPKGLVAMTILTITGVLPGGVVVLFIFLARLLDAPPALIGTAMAGIIAALFGVLPIAWFCGLVARHTRYQRQLPPYREAYELWASSWFCTRCGHTHDPRPALEAQERLALDAPPAIVPS